MVGLYDARDTAGPMARTMTDLVQLLDVIAGVDANDSATTEAAGKIPDSYTPFLKESGARGKRLGVFRQALRVEGADFHVVALLDRALDDLRAMWGQIVDPFAVPEFEGWVPQHHPLSEVRAAIERYLASTGPEFPKTIAEIVAAGKFHPLHEVSLKATAVALPPEQDPIVRRLEASEAILRAAFLRAMDAALIDALVLPGRDVSAQAQWRS